MGSRVSELIAHYRKADRVLLSVLWFIWFCTFAMGMYFEQCLLALLAGGLAVLASFFTILWPGQRRTRVTIAMSAMTLISVQIDISGGLVEIHFGIFTLLAFLVFYRDWLPIVAAAATIALEHIVLYAIQQQVALVHVIHHGGWGTILLHATYVFVESAVLIYLSIRSHQEAVEAESLMAATVGISQAGEGYLDLRHRAQPFGTASNDFNHFLDQLSGVIEGMGHETNDLNTAVTILVQASEALRTGAGRQLDEGAEVAAAITQMGGGIHQVHEHASRAMQAAQGAGYIANAGHDALKDTQIQVTLLARRMEDTEIVVSDLAKKTQEIGEFVSVIQSVAQRTNLLALNAAIEAARAGDNGRGFAVVAAEVRNLSTLTAQSASQIETLVTALIEGSAQASEAVQQSQGDVRHCVTNVRRASEVLESIAGELENIKRVNSGIANEAALQAQVSMTIQGHVNNVQIVAEQNAEAAVQLDHSNGELRNIVLRLARLSGKFLVAQHDSMPSAQQHKQHL
ncbi:methyl-accepting chemotaxis protein [Pseudomonas sp. App30]